MTITPNQNPKANTLLPMLTIGGLFFIFGFVTWLNGALIPFLQIICDLNEIQALFVAFCFYIAYVVMALPMSWLLDKTGYQQGMAMGLGLIALGLLLFVPAARLQAFWLFLTAQFVVGSGLTILQTASNPYIVRLGPEESAAARIAVMGVLNKAAGFLAPMLFTLLVLSDFAEVSKATIDALSAPERELQVTQMANNLVMPYVSMAIVLIILAVALSRLTLPAIQDKNGADNAGDNPDDSAKKSHIFQFPQLVLGVLALFFYVGVEVIAGDTIGLYGSSLGLANVTSLTSYTMAAMVVGYVLGLVLIPKWLSQAQALTSSALLGLVLTLWLVFSSDTSTLLSHFLWGWLGIPLLPDSVAIIALLGLANAMCWPAIWPLALADLGRFTPRGSAILIMGIAGGAVLPLVYGGLTSVFGHKQAYCLLFVGYGIIAWYGAAGYRKRHW
jgi:glucose/galactose transporter